MQDTFNIIFLFTTALSSTLVIYSTFYINPILLEFCFRSYLKIKRCKIYTSSPQCGSSCITGAQSVWAENGEQGRKEGKPSITNELPNL